eukprot:scaffold260256_cov20-Tisochrysis_lutea.AAC.1
MNLEEQGGMHVGPGVKPPLLKDPGARFLQMYPKLADKIRLLFNHSVFLNRDRVQLLWLFASGCASFPRPYKGAKCKFMVCPQKE